MIRSSRKLSLAIGVLGLAYWCILLVSYPQISLVLTAPLLAGAIGLILFGVLKRLTRKRRFLAPLALLAFCFVLLGTLALFFLLGAPTATGVMAAALLTITALATMRAFYIWGPQRTNGLSRYYDS